MKIVNPIGRAAIGGTGIIPFGACWCGGDTDGNRILYNFGWGDGDNCHCSCRVGDDANLASSKQKATAIA